MANSASNDIETISVSIAVSNLERSKRFYSEGLGFDIGVQQSFDIPAGSEDAKNMGLPGGAKLSSCFASREHMRIEMIGFTEPQPYAGDVKPPNRTGLTALHFRVTDAQATATRLVALGGTLIQQWGAVRCVVADPDGVRINCAAIPAEAIKAVFTPAKA